MVGRGFSGQAPAYACWPSWPSWQCSPFAARPRPSTTSSGATPAMSVALSGSPNATRALVRSHGKVVYERVQRCVKVKSPKPADADPNGGAATADDAGTPPSAVHRPRHHHPRHRLSPPVNTSLPTINGSATEGSTLIASTGTWSNEPTSFLYQWRDCTIGGCADIPNATGSSYALQASDVLDSVDVVVTARNVAGSASAVSKPTGVITHSGDPVVVGVGDIACPAGDHTNSCKQAATASLAAAQNPDDVLVLGDNQYDHGAVQRVRELRRLQRHLGGVRPDRASGAGQPRLRHLGRRRLLPVLRRQRRDDRCARRLLLVQRRRWHIIALNSDCSDSGCSDSVAGTTSTAQVTWLQSDLAANRSPCVLAFWHHPLFSAGDIGDSPGVAPLWTALYSAHADVVLNGHDHSTSATPSMDPNGNATTNGIREFVVGTGGENLVALNNPQSTLQASDTKDFGVLDADASRRQLRLGVQEHEWSGDRHRIGRMSRHRRSGGVRGRPRATSPRLPRGTSRSPTSPPAIAGSHGWCSTPCRCGPR